MAAILFIPQHSTLYQQYYFWFCDSLGNNKCIFGFTLSTDVINSQKYFLFTNNGTHIQGAMTSAVTFDTYVLCLAQCPPRNFV
jgi:hypothetical protein